MKFKGKEVKKLRSRQNYMSDVENYCIIKKFIYQLGNLEVRNRQEQTGINF